MFFNYISAATIPPHLSPFNLKLATFSKQFVQTTQNMSTPSRPAWQPEKSPIFRRGGTDGAPNPDKSGFLPRSPFRRPRMATRKISDFSERRNGRSAKSRLVGISSA